MCKRVMDVIIGVVTMIVALPVCVLVAIAVVITSRGPVFFVQERVGRGGQTFRLIKFRTMREGTHEEVINCATQRAEYEANDFKLHADDPRITAVGRLLRATSLDEIPQLVNVVRGEMSIVGIRPLLERELQQRTSYERACYEALPPGMTGLWQINGRSSVGRADRRDLDRSYVERWTFWRDIVILARTPAALLKMRHAK